MTSKQRQSKGKLVKPTFFVFCEGETEEVYVKYLRSLYRLPIEIDTKIAGNRITSQYLDNYKKQKTVHAKDKTFLIYDSDVEDILLKLQKIKGANLLCSKPCFELWYLLHCLNQTAELTTNECVSKLKQNIRNYRKGELNDRIKCKLSDHKDEAISRAKLLTAFSNPSTNVYILVEALETVK
jgi:hypothetical protein